MLQALPAAALAGQSITGMNATPSITGPEKSMSSVQDAEGWLAAI